MKITAFLGFVALSLTLLGSAASAGCYFGTDALTGMETIICESDGVVSTWGTMVAEA
ncbi:hypothetical protein [Ruegeria sp. ANG-S4]|uniref:hypothetical protein n=1 Tax=Ruegeria sp. ANG-S4 TaxID=1577904 RepID=UPI00187CCA66|nr:hypothetical protein [Ruegeria sp. ANG-S4]